MNIRFQRVTQVRIVAVLVIAVMVIQSSCYYKKTSPGWQYMPDMSHSKAYETYAINRFFTDSTNAGLPVTGSIPRGVYMPFHFSIAISGYDSAGMLLHFPSTFNENDKAEGQRLFDIYCAVCHGKDGKGDGTIVNNPKLKNPFPPPPSYYADNLVNLAEGKMYHSVHYGKNLMGPYSKVLDHDQIWKVVYYVKSLQQDYKNSQPKTETAVASADTTKKQ